METYTPAAFNLHTHSWYCKHGSGQLSDYAKEAAKNDLAVLGFSEHCPVPSNRWSDTRMDFGQLDEYLADCRSQGETHPVLRVLTAFECDYDRADQHWYREFLIGEKQVDYLCFGIHTLPYGGRPDVYLKDLPSDKRLLHQYTDRYVEALASRVFLFAAHPDLFGSFYHAWDEEAIACSKEILACASDLNVPLEINGYGMRKPMIETPQGKRRQYPLDRFWELASSYPVKVTAHSDAHTPEDLCKNRKEYLAYAERYNLSLCSLQFGDGKPVLVP